MKNRIHEKFQLRQYAVTTTTPKMGNNTIADLVSWLETFINIIFPDNKIYYWNAREKVFNNLGNTLLCIDPIPTYINTLEGPSHAITYVREGSNEGYMIEVAYMMRDNTFKSVCSAKYLGCQLEAWGIARIISTVLNDAIGYKEWPLLVDMYQRVPRRYEFDRTAKLLETVHVTATTHSLKVHTPSGHVFENLHMHETEDNAVFTIESFKYDWLKVLASLKVNVHMDSWFVPYDQRLSSMEGYYVTTRAHATSIEEGNALGWYVLLPTSDPSLDSSFLGSFDNVDAAVDAAIQHKASKAIALAA